MDASTNAQPTTNPNKPPSVHPTASSTTLAVNPDPPTTTTNQEKKYTPEPYTYTKRTGPGNPDAQPKEKSKLGKFLSKFQTDAVKKSNAAREREKLEEERTGIKKYTASGAPGSTTQSAAAFL